MINKQVQHFNWSFQLRSKPDQLWEYISDTNRVFRMIGLYSIQKTPFSRSSSKGYLELATSRLSSYLVWQEEPYTFERPYKLGCTRHYKIGFFKQIRFDIRIRKNNTGSRLDLNIWVKMAHPILDILFHLYLTKLVKNRFSKFIYDTDNCVVNEKMPYEFGKNYKLVRGAKNRIRQIRKRLIKTTRRQRIVNQLTNYLIKAHDSELESIHPYKLAEYWGEKKYSVLNVFLNAAKLGLLDFKWEINCPTCKSPKYSFRKIQDSHPNLYCDDCDASYDIDFNENTQMVFTLNPLIRKLQNKTYCYGGPQNTPFRATQHIINIGEKKFLNVKLEEGTYLFKTHQHEGHLRLVVREDGSDSTTLYITDDDFDQQEALITARPNLTIINKSSKKIVCFLDKENWRQEAIYASEVTSSHDFRSLFSQETLKEGVKVHAGGITMLFTDLMNSTDLYVQEGDDFAIGQLMSHFKIIQQIVAEERGGIVKTIGDSVMAVFREPVSALKAVERIQNIFTNSTSMGESFKLKAGIHLGDCTAVNLNGRIDYFGKTVNVAARLVDVAKEKEIVVSEAFFNNSDVKRYLDRNRKTLFIKDSEIDLKGFENESFKVKEIRMERTPMRLVI